ncbi:hypothetical protein ACIBLA_35755 [Streptomyces sp. NPDC050433]|uniref:hypothetical protein n=1 Tax=Streptomyces sp. NPDC050433 TaxID=3365615 RepID=UPI003792D33D
MTRLGWQYRVQGSGRIARQRVTVTGAAEVDVIDDVTPRTDPIQVIADHEATCTTCALRTDGGFCQEAARLVREERETRR